MRGTRSLSWTRAPRRRSQGRRCARRCAGARTGSRSCRLGWPRCYASWTASQSDRVSLRGMYPIFVVLLDGLADRAHDSLGGRTANEAADTPNLDRLAARGPCGLIYGVGPGRAPSSEIAHWAMLGYAPEEFPGRGVFEALGAGQEGEP